MEQESFIFPWERQAQRQKCVPDGLDAIDAHAYITLRGIYIAYYHQSITKEDAAREKWKLRRDWRNAREAKRFSDKMTSHHITLWKETELAACACYKKAKAGECTQEDVIRLCEVMMGLQKQWMPDGEEREQHETC